jgi:hypothetical protein
MRVSLAGLLLAATPFAPAHADGIRHFNNYCTPGAFRSCASVTVQVVTLPSGMTGLVLTIRNLEGAIAEANIPGSMIVGFHVGFPVAEQGEVVDDENGSQGSNGATIVGNPFGDTYHDRRGYTGNILWGGFSGIYGCNPASPDLVYPEIGEDLFGSWSTCGSGASVVFTLDHYENLPWDVNNMSVALDFRNPDGTFSNCTMDLNCSPVSAVPEPVTLVLVGTGLAGVAAARRRRRSSVPW